MKVEVPLCASLLVLLMSAPAAAELPTATIGYFDREDDINAAYVAVGSALGVTGIGLISQQDPGLRASGYPLVAVGGIQLLTGALFLAFTPGFRADAEQQQRLGAQHYRDAQTARIEVLEANFKYYKLAEAGAVLTGLALGSAGAATGEDTLTGVGTGLGVAAAVQLSMEFIAADVAAEYLRSLHVMAAPGGSQATVSLSGHF